jgi:hypothetical protein
MTKILIRTKTIRMTKQNLFLSKIRKNKHKQYNNTAG